MILVGHSLLCVLYYGNHTPLIAINKRFLSVVDRKQPFSRTWLPAYVIAFCLVPQANWDIWLRVVISWRAHRKAEDKMEAGGQIFFHGFLIYLWIKSRFGYFQCYCKIGGTSFEGEMTMIFLQYYAAPCSRSSLLRSTLIHGFTNSTFWTFWVFLNCFQ